MERRLAAILIADVVGFSRLMGEDEAGTLAAMKRHRRELIEPKTAQHRGRLIKLMGDGALMEFPSVVDAVTFAVDVQWAMRTRNAPLPQEKQIHYRIGINIGDVVVEADDLYGTGVNVAARIEVLADAGGICLSRTVVDHVQGKLKLTYMPLGERAVKNIKRPVALYRLVLDDKAEALATPVLAVPAPAPAAPSRSRWRLGAAAAAAAATLALAAAVLWWRPWAPGLEPAVVERAALPLPEKPSIAVLPFVNVGGEVEHDHFAAGLTDDLITELSKISGLFVIARNSVFALKDMAANVKKAALDLGVKYVLQGTLRRAGARMRINVQLVEASTGVNIWAERYDRDLSDLFALEDDVIARVISAMAVELTATERSQLARIPTDNLEAYDYFMRAEQEGFYYGDVETYRRTLSYYSKALDLDPNFAEAYAGIARVAVDVWHNDYNLLWPAAVARKIAYDAAGQALRLDADNARAYVVLALLQLVEGRHAEAIASARKAVAVRPNDAEAHGSLGLILARSGFTGEAIAEVERAIRLDPSPSPNFRLMVGVAFYTVQRYDVAVAALEMARAALPQAEPAHEYLAAAYAQQDKLVLAQQAAAALLKLFPTTNLTYYESLYADWRPEDRRHHLEGLRLAGIPVWPFGFEGRDADRLSSKELVGLIGGTTWVGRHRNGTAFVQEFDQAGGTAYRSENTFLTGTVSVDQDQLCMRFDGFYLDRAACGYVYRNSGDGDHADLAYAHVSPLELKYFSLKSR